MSYRSCNAQTKKGGFSDTFGNGGHRKHRTLTIPVVIWVIATLDSQSGYKTTMNEEQNVQIIPITTQAVYGHNERTHESQFG